MTALKTTCDANLVASKAEVATCKSDLVAMTSKSDDCSSLLKQTQDDMSSSKIAMISKLM